MTLDDQEFSGDVLLGMAARLVEEFRLSAVGDLDGQSPLLSALERQGVAATAVDSKRKQGAFDLVIARPRPEIGSKAAEELAARAVQMGRRVLWLPCNGEPYRWPTWWDSILARQGLVPLDIVRGWLWNDTQVPLEIKQSACIYVRPEDVPEDWRPSVLRDVVHPELHGQLVSAARWREERSEQRLVDIQNESANAVRRTERQLEALERRIGSIADEIDEQRVAISASQRSITRSQHVVGRGQREDGTIRSSRSENTRPTLRRAVAGISVVTAKAASRGFTEVVPPRVLRALSSRSLCDWDWYRQTYLADEPMTDPVVHYLKQGSRQRFKPHPLLDPVWYHEQHSEHVGGADALLHYELLGRQRMLSPHPLFEPSWYAGQFPGLQSARTNSAMHYLIHGWRRRCDPHPLFSSNWYLRQYPDVAEAYVNPLLHYLIFGWREGRHPSPLFHPEWYMKQAGLEKGTTDPLEHFICFGAAYGLAPSPLLDPSWYRRRYGLSGDDPLMAVRHFVAHGLPAGLVGSQWDADIRKRAAARPRNLTSGEQPELQGMAPSGHRVD